MEIREQEVRPAAVGQRYGGPEAEGSEAGGPGARAFGRGAGGDFSGALRCHSGVEKLRVILRSLEVRGGKPFHFTARSQ